MSISSDAETGNQDTKKWLQLHRISLQ